jgi:hypothetical protein
MNILATLPDSRRKMGGACTRLRPYLNEHCGAGCTSYSSVIHVIEAELPSGIGIRLTCGLITTERGGGTHVVTRICSLARRVSPGRRRGRRSKTAPPVPEDGVFLPF